MRKRHPNVSKRLVSNDLCLHYDQRGGSYPKNKYTIVSSSGPILTSPATCDGPSISHDLRDGPLRSLACSAGFSFMFSRSWTPSSRCPYPLRSWDSILEVIVCLDHLSSRCLTIVSPLASHPLASWTLIVLCDGKSTRIARFTDPSPSVSLLEQDTALKHLRVPPWTCATDRTQETFPLRCGGRVVALQAWVSDLVFSRRATFTNWSLFHGFSRSGIGFFWVGSKLWTFDPLS